ncbi:MAG: hypothetical protein LBD23_19930 [Oscillospiraceae bacterium]|jgi:hypothetical protein|nr:hypothetical protein [Oscillospiraceae bacterium]
MQTNQSGNDYNKLLDEVIKKINSNPNLDKFILRDIISNPPSGLGIKFINEVKKGKNGRLPNIKHLGQNNKKLNYYQKVTDVDNK